MNIYEMTAHLLLNKDVQILLFIGLTIVYLFILIFWLVMLVDAVRNRNTQGAVWIIIVALAGFIGSVLYYFMVKRKRQRKESEPFVSPQSGAYYLGGTQKDDVIKY